MITEIECTCPTVMKQYKWATYSLVIAQFELCYCDESIQQYYQSLSHQAVAEGSVDKAGSQGSIFIDAD